MESGNCSEENGNYKKENIFNNDNYKKENGNVWVCEFGRKRRKQGKRKGRNEKENECENIKRKK